MTARIALWEPPMTAIVIASSRGSTSESRLGLRTVSRFNSLSPVEDDAPAPVVSDGRDLGDEPVQRIRRGVETSMLEDGSVDWSRTVHLDFCSSLILEHTLHTMQHPYDNSRYPQN